MWRFAFRITLAMALFFPAIEKFHTQTIKPQHGTAALVVFTLSAPEAFDKLIYDDQAGNQLTLALKP